MSTLRNVRAWSWAFPLLLWLAGNSETSFAEEGFFEVAGPLLVPPIVTHGNVALAPDGFTLYFGASTLGGLGGDDIWIARRERTHDENGDPVPFTEPFENLDEINSQFDERDVTLSPDGKRLYFVTDRKGRLGDIWLVRRDAVEDEDGNRIPFGDPENLEEINSPVQDGIPVVSRDERIIVFHSAREGSLGPRDVWMASREAIEDEDGNRIPFSEPVNLREVNSSSYDVVPYCLDGLTLFFTSYRAGNGNLYVARRERIEDANGDRVPFGSPVGLGPPLDTGSADYILGFSWDWPSCGAQVAYAAGEERYLTVWHPDCNRNREDDCEDIDGGRSSDDNGNSRPDECEPPPAFLRSDANANGNIDVSDAVFVLAYLFLGGSPPGCEASADSDDSGVLDVTDAVYLLEFLFLGGPSPTLPFPTCGPDPTTDDLTCDSFEPCEEP